MKPVRKNVILKTKPAVDTVTTTGGLNLYVDTSYNIYFTNTTKAKIVSVSKSIEREYPECMDCNYALVNYLLTRSSTLKHEVYDKKVETDGEENIYVADADTMVYAFIKTEGDTVVKYVPYSDNYVLKPLLLPKRKHGDLIMYNSRKYHNAVAEVIAAPKHNKELEGKKVIIAPFSDNLTFVFPEKFQREIPLFITKETSLLAVLNDDESEETIDIYHHVPPHLTHDIL